MTDKELARRLRRVTLVILFVMTVWIVWVSPAVTLWWCR